jgi:hypothetical protein
MSNKEDKRRKKDDFFDDGRVIADMNLPGLRRNVFDFGGTRGFDVGIEKKDLPRREDGEPSWTFRERLSLYFGAISSLLLFALILFGGIALFLILWLHS